jgi:Cache domain
VLDLSLQAVVEGLADPEVVASPPHLRRRVLFDRSATAKNLGALVVFDTDGNVVIDAGSTPPRQVPPVTDRDFFQAQQQPGQGLFISRPYRSRLIESDVIGLSRRVYDDQGSFTGVVLGTIKLSYFIDLFRQLRLGSKGGISILRKDGVTLARHPSSGSPQAEEVKGKLDISRMLTSPSGNFVAQSATDGVERMFTFKHVGDLPLIVSMALATDDIFAEWWKKVVLLGVVLFVVCAATVALTLFLMKELQRRSLAEEALTAANAELV